MFDETLSTGLAFTWNWLLPVLTLSAVLFVVSFLTAVRKLGSLKTSWEAYNEYLHDANDNQRYSGLIMNEKNYPAHIFNIATSWFRHTPNVFLAGAMKGGTTTLHDWLNQHPCVTGGLAKEVHFFDARSVFGDWVFSEPVEVQQRLLASYFPTFLYGWFCRLFYGSAPAIVEATPINLYFGKWVAPQVKELCPNAKIIHVLRDPFDRMQSHYNFGQEWGYDPKRPDIEGAIRVENKRHPWEKLFEACQTTGHIGAAAQFGGTRDFAYHSYVSRGYYEGVDHYVKAFGKENVLVLTLDELSRAPQETMNKVFEFLNLKPVEIDAVPKNTTTA